MADRVAVVTAVPTTEVDGRDELGHPSSSSAIWTALRAAPLRRLSLLTNRARPRPSLDAGVGAEPADVAGVAAGGLRAGSGCRSARRRAPRPAARWPARPRAAGANSALIDSEWPVKTGTRTHVPDTARSRDRQDLAALVAELLLLVGLERAVVDDLAGAAAAR